LRATADTEPPLRQDHRHGYPRSEGRRVRDAALALGKGAADRRSGTDRCMRFLPLIWSGIWRKPGRTILIFLQVCVAFALFGVLQGLKTGVEQLIGQTRADVLLVHGNLALFDPLP